MNVEELPELPPRFRWFGYGDEISLEAKDTEWSGPGQWEGIAYIDQQKGDLLSNIWRLREDGTGFWETVGGPLSSVEEGARYLWTLVQLGEVHFTFREEEECPTTQQK